MIFTAFAESSADLITKEYSKRSFAVKNGRIEELPERFQQWRGCDLHEHAPAMGGKGDQEEVRRVMCDYQETLSELLLTSSTFPALNAYLSRCQSVPQQGRPHNDLLLYWPVSDLWMSAGSRERRFTVHQSEWIENTACGEAGRWLMKQGHPFDFVSDAQIG